ncbi:MAG: hypothetical protein AAGH74_00330 [Pseudomonadota bacterium]
MSPDRIAVRGLQYGAAVVSLFWCYIHYLGGFFITARQGQSWGNDDAFITFRYAQNLIEHGILSFNLNDVPPVEGFSNPFHLALSALVYALVGKDLLYPVIAVLGALCAAASVLVTVSILRRSEVSDHGVLVGAWCVALCPSIWINATSGLETSFVFLGQLLLFAQLQRIERGARGGAIRLGLIVGILTGLRTDGFIVPFAAAVWLILRKERTYAVVILASLAAVFFGLMAARYGYFGELMPNTYYAKVSAQNQERLIVAIGYLGAVSLQNGLLVGMILMSVIALRHLRAVYTGSRNLFHIDAGLLFFLALVPYYIAIGGDIYRDRFLLVLFAIAAITAVQVCDRFGPAILSGVALVTISAQLASFAYDPRLTYDFIQRSQDQYLAVGKHLNKNFRTATVAVDAAGKIPFFSEAQTIDMLGLNEKYIARTKAQGAIPGHMRYEPAYVLERAPDLICSHMFPDGSLFFGMTLPLYQQHGYRWEFLAKQGAAPDRMILPVVGLELSAITELVEEGYTYACLKRSH